MADPILAIDDHKIAVLSDDKSVAAIRAIDLSPPQGDTAPQTHVLVSLTG